MIVRIPEVLIPAYARDLVRLAECLDLRRHLRGLVPDLAELPTVFGLFPQLPARPREVRLRRTR